MFNENSEMFGVVEGFYGRPWTAEQRHDLFSRLEEIGLNSYLYAPKDDEKHRAKWRELYTEAESNMLRSLIQSATSSNIMFIYALSPGVDITYSSDLEVQMVKEKLQQVQDMGCRAFALLFDDILAEMRPEDKKTFDSFADAQVFVTNDCYEALGKPKFSFCPTEYRASVGLLTNPYLTTIGQKLNPAIDVMWTGPAVISRTLTEDHLRDVASVIKRKPLIWDNLHANDYDPKRVFMGPFNGRSVHIKKLISGLLLNPNCQYEANFLPLYTLSEWYRSTEDCDTIQSNDVAFNTTFTQQYDPKQSLARGIAKWINVINGGVGPPIPPTSQIESQLESPTMESGIVSSAVPALSIRTCEGNDMLPIATNDLPVPIYTSPIGTATTITVQAYPIADFLPSVSDRPSIPQIVNSLSIDYSEPMETNCQDQLENANLSPMDDSMAIQDRKLSHGLFENASSNGRLSGTTKISIFVDFFYLPFSYGMFGIQALKDFQWLHEHAHVVYKPLQDADNQLVNEWKNKASAFGTICRAVSELHVELIDVPNKSLVQEIFPFVWDVQSILSILHALIQWMDSGNLSQYPEKQGEWWDTSHLQDEPWTFGGGLLSDLHKLILKNPDINELFSVRHSFPPTSHCYTLYPVTIEDISSTDLYDNFSLPEEKTMYNNQETFYNALISIFHPTYTSANHFVAKELFSNENETPCAYMFCIPNVQSTMQKDVHYQQRCTTMGNNNALPFDMMPDDFLLRYPSYFDLRWRSMYFDPPHSLRRVLQCGTVALSLNGSNGCFTIIPSNFHEKIELYLRLGFQRCSIAIPNFELIVMVEESISDIISDDGSVDRNSTPLDSQVVVKRSTLFGYSLGHVYNDMCASMWFSYLMIFLEKVIKMKSWHAGFLMLTGQVADAIATPIIGFVSDSKVLPQVFLNWGQRLPWHFFGFLLVSGSFPFVFSQSILDDTSENGKVIYYAPFIILFQIGWATELESCQRTLSTVRLAASVLSNLAIFIALFLLFSMDSESAIGPQDISHFRTVALVIVGSGATLTLMFYILVKESNYNVRRSASVNHDQLSIKYYLCSPWFYIVGIIYMLCRLYGNLTQVYFPLYITMTMELPKKYLGILPMVSYIFCFLIYTFMSSRCMNKRVNRNMLLILGCVFALLACILVYLKVDYKITFVIAALMGTAQSLLLTSAFAFCNFLIRNDRQSSAFVYGSMSFSDKLLNGVVYQLIEVFNPSCEPNVKHEECALFYRHILAYVPASCAIILVLLAIGSITFHSRVVHNDETPLLDDGTVNTTDEDGIQSFQ